MPLSVLVRYVSAGNISLTQLAAMTKSSNEEKYKKQREFLVDLLITLLVVRHRQFKEL